MSQVTIYLPDELHREVKAKAKESGKSLSAFMADLARDALRIEAKQKLESLFGSCEGLEVVEDTPPDPVEF